jgi:WD40 repeat protein
LGPAQTEFLPVLLDPGLRFVFTLGTAMRPLLVYRPPNLAVPETIALPGNSGVSAWALSGDGKVLALGDFEGRVFLMDTATLHLRTLPIARGREITWIDFSEDNAWLAAASFDGSVHAFDVATGDSLVAGEMNHDFDVQHVGLSHQHRLLIASGEGRTALWRLPLPGSRAVPAQRIGLAPAAHGLVGGPYSVGWSAATGMFASAGLDGQVRLWRLPDSPLRPARSARQFPDRTDFDGHKLVDVEWDRIRIVSTRDDALTPWLKLPQPPGFAELFDRGRSLLVTTGAQLRVYDPADLHLRFAPVVLANSPQRLLVSPNGRRLLMSFGAHGPDGFLEQLELFDAATGARLPGMAEIRGPLRHIAFSADGARVLAVGPADGGTQVLSGSDLHVIGDYPNDPTQPAVWADFAPAGDEVVMVTRATDARVGGDQLLYWRPSSERARTIDLPARIRPLGVLVTTDGAFVAGSDQDAFATSGVVRPVERLARSEPLAVVAANPNRNLVARAFRREIQLYDAGTGALIGPPLASDSLAMDTIVQLAFSPDGNHLLARTVQGHWLIWSVASEPRKTDELVKSLQYLSVSGENQHAVWVPGPGERATLRANDPGAWHPPDPRPTTAMAGNARPGVGIPAGLTGTSPVMLDLAPFYDFPPEESRNSFYNIRPTMRPLPTGVVSVAGTDFDVRGMMQVGAKSGTAGPANPSLSIRCLPLPRVPVAAIHLLLTASEPDALPTGSAIATLTLHYIDGGSEAIPIRAGQELRGFSGHDQGVPLAFAPDPVLALYGYENDVFAVPRLANPFPGRLASCLDLQATTAEGVLLLMGITVEPTAAAAPVISSAR